MKKPITEIIAFLENHNAWRRGSDDHEPSDPTELGQCIDQAVETLKGMGWQPMDTAPHDREFLGVWGSSEGYVLGYDVYLYIGNGVFESVNAVDERFPNKFYKIFAWMDIPKYKP